MLNRNIFPLILTVLSSLSAGGQNLVKSGRFKVLTDKSKNTIYYIHITEAAQKVQISSFQQFLEYWKQLHSDDLKTQLIAAQVFFYHFEIESHFSRCLAGGSEEMNHPSQLYYVFDFNRFLEILKD